MKITLVVATSRDGFINHFGEKHVYNWSSPEDQKHYSETLERYKLKLMGLNTYEAYEDVMKLSSHSRRIIFTHHPGAHKDVPGMLEFTNEPIPTVLAKLEAEGFKHALLVGGGQLFEQFLKEKLVDEVYLTIEPLTFGEGIPFLPGGGSINDFTYLELANTLDLNEKGTILRHYLRK